MNRYYFVYILTNYSLTLYTGITNNIVRRLEEHENKVNPDSFTSKYNINRLVYYESFDNPQSAIIREKQIKHLKRQDKIDLIRTKNPQFLNLKKELQKLDF